MCKNIKISKIYQTVLILYSIGYYYNKNIGLLVFTLLIAKNPGV